MKANWIGGEWVSATDATSNINPSDIDDVVGDFAQSSVAQVAQAVEAAKQAAKSWAFSNPQLRSDILEKAGDLILARKEMLGDLLAREEGKTLPEASGEVVRAAQIFKFFAGECVRTAGDILPSIRDGVGIEITREPLGIVGVIAPWNFPIAIPAWKIAPALAYGNCVVFKPADLTPASAHALTEILIEAGLPAGVLNLVMGRGSVVGEAMLDHPDINGISFTGSAGIGKHVAVKCAESLKKVQLEMGGKNPMVVLDDADLDIAVATCLNGAFFSTGQRCTASSRLIVQADIHDAFVEKLSNAMSKLVIGDARDAKTQIGPVVDRKQLNANLGYVELAKEQGAEVIGGQEVECATKGFYQAPALFVGATNDMRISREEIFGPCASVIKVGDYEEALSLANDTEFGLSSGICTQSLKHATDFKRRSEAGMVMVNLPTAGVDYHVPFGGRKGSSYGSREQGRYAVEFYTSVKTAYTYA